MTGCVQRFALVGKTGVGKTEVARCLLERGFVPCKTGAICRQISNLLFGNDWKVNTQRISDALIALEPSIFLKAALRTWDRETPTVIDALRYRTDLEAARAEGFSIIRVVASEEDRVRWLRERGEVFDLAKDGPHQTEVELDSEDADITINNNATIDELKRQVHEALVTP
jgi:dephospho-CoA kinase